MHTLPHAYAASRTRCFMRMLLLQAQASPPITFVPTPAGPSAAQRPPDFKLALVQ